jgi:hypothetical protein
MKRNLAIVGVVALVGSVICFQHLQAQQAQTPPPTFGGTSATGQTTPPTTPEKPVPADKATTSSKPIHYEYKIDEVSAYVNPASSTTLLSDLNDGGWEISAVIPIASDLLPANVNGNSGGVVVNQTARTVHYTQVVLRRPKQ